LRVLYFGTYERRYPRNAQVISCLRRAGVEVRERHEPVWEGSEHKWRAGLGAGLRLAAAEAKLLARPGADGADAILVGYPGHLDVPAARRAAHGRPVVFNPLVSLSDTLVADRGRFRSGSIPARALEALDRRALRAADLVVADTAANARHLTELATLNPDLVTQCYVGAEERLFRPVWKAPEQFAALFVGKLIPLHGLETVLEAARIASEVPFRVVGSGQLESLLRDRPANVDWVPWVEYERLPEELARAGCALGVFGTSQKAARVIPNKAFQALACGTPLVTADTPAACELLADRDSALLVPPGDPEALATAIRALAADHELARRIGERGRAVYEAEASEEVLGKRWRGLFERLVA
jgi:glycosyltransferase involved in cell wall biosynthesis